MADSPFDKLLGAIESGEVDTRTGRYTEKPTNDLVPLIKKQLRGDVVAKRSILEDIQREKEETKTALGALKNAGVEATDIIQGMGILGAKALKGSANIAFRATTNPSSVIDDVTSGRAASSLGAGLSGFVDAVKDDFKYRYSPLLNGDYETFFDRAYEKPLSLLLDISGASSLAGGAFKSVGKSFAEAAAGKAISKTGTVLTKIGQVLDPVHLAKEGAKKGFRELGEKLPNAPIIGKRAVALRQVKKEISDRVIEEVGIGRRETEILQKQIRDTYADLATLEKERIHQVLWGWEGVPADATPQFKKAIEFHRQLLNDPAHIDDLGILSEEVRRRKIAPLIQKKIYDGELKFSPELETQLFENGFLKEGETIEGLIGGLGRGKGRELKFPGGMMDVPEQLFIEAEQQLSTAEKMASYFPAVAAEAKLRPDNFIFRTGPSFTNIKSGFQKPFTGEIVNRVLRSKDPGILADAQRVMEQYAYDVNMAKTMKRIETDILSKVDPATGQKVAKRVYIGGRIPKNLLGMESADDIAKVVDAMVKPLQGSIDDIYRETVGVSKEAVVAKLRKQYSGLSAAAAESRADDIVASAMASKGYGGFIVTKGKGAGRYKFTDEALNPFTELLPNHVVYAPEGTLKFFRSQQKLAQGALPKVKAGASVDEAVEAAIQGSLSGDDALLKSLGEEYEIAAKKGLELLNTDLLDVKQFKEVAKRLRAKGVNLDIPSAYGELQQYSKAVNKYPGKGQLSVAKQHWAYQIPREVADSVQSIYAPLLKTPGWNTALRLYWDTPMQAWRSLALPLSVRWQTNNFVGNLALNTVSGVLNPLDYARALPYTMYRLADRFPKSIGAPAKKLLEMAGYTGDDLARVAKTQEEMYRRMGMGSFFKSELHPIDLSDAADTLTAKAYSAFAESLAGRTLRTAVAASTDFNQIVDNFFRDANLISKVRGELRKESKGVAAKVAKGFWLTEKELYDYVTRPNNQTLNKLVKQVEEFLPNYEKLLNPAEKKIVRRFVAPFYSWTKHMTILTMMMPLNHPKRAWLLSKLGKYAKEVEEQEWAEAGVDPKYVRGLLHYLSGSILVDKQDDTVKFWNVRNANPFGTFLDIPNLGQQLHPFVKDFMEEALFRKDLFKDKEFKKRIELNRDGFPIEVTDRDMMTRFTEIVPQLRNVLSIINPEVRDEAGDVVFKRDRMLEALKLLGYNITERSLSDILEKAKKLEAQRLSKGISQELRKKSNDTEALQRLLEKAYEYSGREE